MACYQIDYHTTEEHCSDPIVDPSELCAPPFLPLQLSRIHNGLVGCPADSRVNRQFHIQYRIVSHYTVEEPKSVEVSARRDPFYRRWGAKNQYIESWSTFLPGPNRRTKTWRRSCPGRCSCNLKKNNRYSRKWRLINGVAVFLLR